MPQGEFTASQAIALFRQHTGYEFHPTVPGQLLARRQISKSGQNAKRQATYDARHWPQLWGDMLALAIDRCRYDKTVTPPANCPAPALMTADRRTEQVSLRDVRVNRDQRRVVAQPNAQHSGLSSRATPAKSAQRRKSAGQTNPKPKTEAVRSSRMLDAELNRRLKLMLASDD